MSAVPEDNPTTSARADRSRRPMSPTTWAWFGALLGWTALLAFYDLGGGARFEPIDSWVAQTAREMLAADQWLIPQFSGEVRMQKSPGPYWAVMLVSLWRGGIVDETSARIPSALLAAGLVVTIFWLARRIAGDRAAIFAGFAASSSVLFLVWSHRAASDLGLAALTTLSLAALWVAVEDEPHGPRRVALLLLGYFAAGLGMLYKLPMPLAVVGIPALSYVLLRWRWRALASWWHLAGLALFLLPWLPWAIGVCLVEDAALWKWKVEYLDRFTGALPNYEGQDNWRHYLTYFGPPLLFCLPYTLSLPMSLFRAFRRQPGVNRNGTMFMLIWFVSLFAFLTASAGKEWRYLLPALPPLFVLLGIELAAFFDPARPARPRLDLIGLIVVWIGVPLGVVVGITLGLRTWWQERGQYELEGLHAWPDVWRPAAVAGALLAIGCGLAAWLYYRRRGNHSFGALVVTMWAMWLYAWPNVAPKLQSARPFIDFARQLADPQVVPPHSRDHLFHVGSQDPRIIWYSDVRYPRLIDQLQLLEEQGGIRNLEWETQRYGAEMVRRLAADEPVLMVARFEEYLAFVNMAPPRLAAEKQALPPLHVWLQTRYGTEDEHFLLFGNQPPPFPEPSVHVRPAVRAKLNKKGWQLEWPATQPATHAEQSKEKLPTALQQDRTHPLPGPSPDDAP